MQTSDSGSVPLFRRSHQQCYATHQGLSLINPFNEAVRSSVFSSQEYMKNDSFDPYHSHQQRSTVSLNNRIINHQSSEESNGFRYQQSFYDHHQNDAKNSIYHDSFGFFGSSTTTSIPPNDLSLKKSILEFHKPTNSVDHRMVHISFLENSVPNLRNVECQIKFGESDSKSICHQLKPHEGNDNLMTLSSSLNHYNDDETSNHMDGLEKIKPPKMFDEDKDEPLRSCANCQTKNTPLWRRYGIDRFLCNACGLYQRVNGSHRPLARSKNKTFRSTNKPSSTNNNQTKNASKRTSLKCVNCKTNTTSMWRRNALGQPVCNACGLYFRLNGVNRPVEMRRESIRTRKRRRLFPNDEDQSFKPCLKQSWKSDSKFNVKRQTSNVINEINEQSNFFPNHQHRQQPWIVDESNERKVDVFHNVQSNLHD